MKKTHVIISGDVHNVGFRSWVKHKADLFGILGWVKNIPDTKVEAVFESENENDIQEMINECKRGPPGSYVENIEVSKENSKEEFNSFEILR